MLVYIGISYYLLLLLYAYLCISTYFFPDTVFTGLGINAELTTLGCPIITYNSLQGL